MDEPTAALAADEAATLLRIVQLCRAGHDGRLRLTHLEEVLAVATPSRVLRDGALVRTAPAARRRRVARHRDAGPPPPVSSRREPAVAADAPVVLAVRGLTRAGGSRCLLRCARRRNRRLTGLIGSGRSRGRPARSSAPRSWTPAPITLDGEPLGSAPRATRSDVGS